VGRPRTRWADVVQRDALQLLGIRGWRRRAENRDEWRHLMREVKVSEGAVAPYMDGWRQLCFTGYTTELGRKTAFCELVPSCMKEKPNSHTRFERRSLVETVRITYSPC